MYEITLLFSGVAALFYILHAGISRWHHAKRARDLGCKPPPSKVNRLPLGIDGVLELNQADREHIVPQQVMKIFEEVGHSTFQRSLLGTTLIITNDPLNIRAILATQFRDFELGSKRRGNFFPMLGNGIFTADGEVW